MSILQAATKVSYDVQSSSVYLSAHATCNHSTVISPCSRLGGGWGDFTEFHVSFELSLMSIMFDTTAMLTGTSNFCSADCPREVQALTLIILFR